MVHFSRAIVFAVLVWNFYCAINVYRIQPSPVRGSGVQSNLDINFYRRTRVREIMHSILYKVRPWVRSSTKTRWTLVLFKFPPTLSSELGLIRLRFTFTMLPFSLISLCISIIFHGTVLSSATTELIDSRDVLNGYGRP